MILEVFKWALVAYTVTTIPCLLWVIGSTIVSDMRQIRTKSFDHKFGLSWPWPGYTTYPNRHFYSFASLQMLFIFALLPGFNIYMVISVTLMELGDWVRKLFAK